VETGIKTQAIKSLENYVRTRNNDSREYSGFFGSFGPYLPTTFPYSKKEETAVAQKAIDFLNNVPDAKPPSEKERIILGAGQCSHKAIIDETINMLLPLEHLPYVHH